MNKLTDEDQIHINAIKSLLLQKYEGLIISIYCYGSRVTQNVKDTDFDILLLTKTKIDWKTEYEMSQIIVRYGIYHDIVFDPQFMCKDEFELKQAKFPYVQNVKLANVVI
ncbi:MAG: hypothetical protein WC557_02975 [Ignavibacteriaceae bacterium]